MNSGQTGSFTGVLLFSTGLGKYRRESRSIVWRWRRNSRGRLSSRGRRGKVGFNEGVDGGVGVGDSVGFYPTVTQGA